MRTVSSIGEPPMNALAIDTEEWFHSEWLRGQRLPIFQVVNSTKKILDLLDRYQIKASFFIVGEVAERHPDLVLEIFEKGHEIGCHGFSHRPLWRLNEGILREELSRFQTLIERILGKIRIKGFRAPCFSINHQTRWALNVLIEYGYQYDASLFPIKISPPYWGNGTPIRPYRISLENIKKEDPSSPLIEFPTVPLVAWKLKIPIAGGFNLRVLPLSFIYWGLKRINQTQPFLFHFHPWEGSPEIPKLKIPLFSRFVTTYGIPKALKKFEYILSQFKFTRLDRILGLEEI